MRLHVLLFERDLRRRYNPNWEAQPRAPAGDPDGGQWTDGGGRRETRDGRSRPNADGGAGGVLLAGGFTEQQRDMSVQSFVSAHCKASLQRASKPILG